MQRLITIKDRIQSENVIRIAMDITAGFGNQVASLHLMERLRKLGFNGVFEVIYSAAGKDKVGKLFNLPENFADTFLDKTKGMQFISLLEHFKRIENNTLELINFGMTGAMASASYENYSLWNATEKIKYDEIFAKKIYGNPYQFGTQYSLYVRVYIQFDSHYDKINRIYSKDNPGSLSKQPNSRNKFFLSPPLPHLFDGYLASNEFADISKKNPALPNLIEQIQKQKINFLPVYGYPITELYRGYIWNIMQIIVGARYAQINGPVEFSKPLIMAVFYDYQKEIETIKDNLNNVGIDEENLSDSSRHFFNTVRELNIVEHLSFAKLSDPQLQNKIQDLKSGQIFLISMGTLPRELFDRLYTYENSWAPVREGASSFNTLILTGRPHMRCGFGWDYDPPNENQHLWFHEFHEKFCHGEVSWLKHGDKLARWVGEFFIKAHDRDSSLSQWFLGWQQESLVLENNRIMYGLDEGIKLLESTPGQLTTIPKPGSVSPDEWKQEDVSPAPESLDKVVTYAIGSGIMAGLSDTLKYTFQKKKYSQNIAEAAKYTAYFTSTFAMHFCHSYANQDISDYWQRTTTSLSEAGIKTGKLMAVHVGLFATTKLLPRCRSMSDTTRQCVKKTVLNTYLAYQLWQKPISVGLAAVTSAVSEKVTQKLGKFVVDRTLSL